MPLKWERDKNPYVSNYFSRLHIGPNTKRGYLDQLATGLKQKLACGLDVKCAGGHPLDEHAINEASRKLLEPSSLAEELLLVHPQPQRVDKKKMKALANQLRKKAVLPDSYSPVPLHHPAGVFWFLPAPGPESIELPPWNEFGFVEPGDPDDLKLDIVFDS